MPKKQISTLILFLAWILSGCTASEIRLIVPTTPTPVNASQAAEVIFDTSEAAITAYFAAIAEGDPQQILQTCAVDEMSEKFDFARYIDRLQAFIPLQALAPTDDPFYVAINKAQLSSQILNQVKMFTYSLLSSEEIESGSPILKMDAARIDEFRHAVDLKRLASIHIEKIALPNQTLMNDARYVENVAKIAKIYGADEMTERAVLFSFDENNYLLGFTLLRYGEAWKISSPTSVLAGTSALGVAQKTSTEEFEMLTSR